MTAMFSDNRLLDRAVSMTKRRLVEIERVLEAKPASKRVVSVRRKAAKKAMKKK